MTISTPSKSFTRPANTTTYTVGDLVANSATAASVQELLFDLGPKENKDFFIRRAVMHKSGISTTNASFRLHLYKTKPTAVNGDNGIFSTNNSSNYIGAIDISVDRAFTDGACGAGVPLVGSEIALVSEAVKLYGLLECRGAYTPVNSESFSVLLEIHRG